MKKLSYLPFLAIVLVMGLGSCQKEQNDDCIRENPDNNEAYTSAETPEGFADQLPAAFEAMEVFGGTESEAFYLENDGIPTFLDEEPLEAEAREGKKATPCRLEGKLELDRERKAKLLASWKDYLECRKTAMIKIRALHRELHQRIENRREELVKAYHSERLSEREFKVAMEKLRQEFKAQSLRLKKAHHETIKHCYQVYLEHVQRILTPEQFKIFMHCHKRNLPQR